MRSLWALTVREAIDRPPVGEVTAVPLTVKSGSGPTREARCIFLFISREPSAQKNATSIQLEILCPVGPVFFDKKFNHCRT